jgi:hypothetical protein
MATSTLEVLPDILFTEEDHFTHAGINNARNSHSWAHENLHVVAECYFQRRFSVNVWCGVSGNYFVGPRFIEGHLAAVYGRDFLQNDFPLYLEDVPLLHGILTRRSTSTFQQTGDGVPH